MGKTILYLEKFRSNDYLFQLKIMGTVFRRGIPVIIDWTSNEIDDNCPEVFMTIEFDDNGKFFTDIIPKTPVPAMIQTTTHQIHGSIHVHQGQRIKDELDLPEKFVAITDAIIYSPDDQALYQTRFLAVQRCEIIWVIPDSEISDPSKASGK